ncbi:MAG: LysR family transcriptional regulator [Burkholderiales bacterium]|nr:LysR family transcriptional regulator [Burkholderiales bacterium]
MNLKQLRYFCGVVEAGNARAAAEKLFVAPTAISMQLAQLEKTLGGQLFDRGSRPMGLTPLGQFVYSKARELLAAASRLEREARGVAEGKMGWLGIGFTRSTIFSFLPEAVRAMQADFPNVRIELMEILTEDQARSLRNDVIHLGVARVIGHYVQEPDLAYTRLFDDPLVAAVPLHHPLAARKSLVAADLATLPYITYPGNANSHFPRQVLALLQAAGAIPRIGHEAKEIHTALGLVAAALGATVVGRSVATNNRTDICFLPITDVKECSTVIAVRKANRTYPLADSFMTTLRAQVAVNHLVPQDRGTARGAALPGTP